LLLIQRESPVLLGFSAFREVFGSSKIGCFSVFGSYPLIFPKQGAFANKKISEIVDLNVFKKYQNQGIGNKLLDAVENLAKDFSDTVCLAVGLHSGYGNAQKIYAQRGYITDGSGVWYKDKPAVPYQDYCNDDDLVLYMSKKLI